MEHVSVNTVDVVNLKINGIACRAPAGATVLEAAHGAGIAIPTLCYLKELNAIGACRICVVEVKGAKNLVPACVYPIADGMEVYRAGPGGTADQPEADPVHPQSDLPDVQPKRTL